MLADQIHRARLNAKMTQEDLAEKAGVTREYVSLLERGKRVPTITVFIRLARALGLSPADLVHQIEKSLAKPK